ncbi:hypothetical protein LCM17_06555 [Cereibacter sphaeroides]|nr:hypothetical protein [Cereibacter sphaeroides]
MSDALPKDFDSAWYAATYPDVALTGMDPAQHFLRFGKMLGRRTHAGDAGSLNGAAKAAAEAGMAPPRPSRPGPIIDRPEGFETASIVPGVALPAFGAQEQVTLTQLTDGSPCAPAAAVALHSYARLVRLPVPAELTDLAKDAGAGADDLAASAIFREGDTRIETLWLPDAGTLRLRLASGTPEAAAPHAGWVLRAFQADARAPGQLCAAGDGLVLPAVGPVFWDITLVHSLMPVLLHLVDPQGTVQASTLIAFPSLAPGGLHSAEIRALQSHASPVDAFWSHTNRLLREILEQAGGRAASVTRIQADLRGATGAEPLFGEPMLDWLEAVFGLWVEPADPEKTRLTLGETALHDALQARAARKPAFENGLSLSLRANAVPTLAVLASRQLGTGGTGEATGKRPAPYLVAEDFSLRPRWMVTPPANIAPDDDTEMPVLTGPGTGSVHVPAAILLRPSTPPRANRLMLPIAPDAQAGSPSPAAHGVEALSVVLTAVDPQRCEDLMRSLAPPTALKVMARLVGPDVSALRRGLDAALGAGNWREVPQGADLRSLAREAKTRLLLTLDDRVVLQDPGALAQLVQLLDCAPDVASASCLLLGERASGKKSVLEPATGGLFPMGVSFAAAPALCFGEPDTFQALPDTRYAVAANTLLLTLWRREALAALPLPDGPVPAEAADIALGLAVLAAGGRNLCSSKIRAGFLGDYARRDVIDPAGVPALRPGDWETLLGRVTLLRELF